MKNKVTQRFSKVQRAEPAEPPHPLKGVVKVGPQRTLRSKVPLRSTSVIPTAGLPCDCDEAHFDGWYIYRKHAEEIFELFKQRYPEFNVSLVQRVRVEWREMRRVLTAEQKAKILDRHRARQAYFT